MTKVHEIDKIEWRDNTKRYLFWLGLVEELYKMKRINFKQKKEIEKELDKSFTKNYWKLNPNLQNPLLKEILETSLNTYEITRGTNEGNSD